MALSAWLSFFDRVSPRACNDLVSLLQGSGIGTRPVPPSPDGFGVMIFAAVNSTVLDSIRVASRSSIVLAIAVAERGLESGDMWALLRAGAADVLVWPTLPDTADQVAARLIRWDAVNCLAESPRVSEFLVGKSAAWRSLVRQVVEVGAFTQASVLIVGESGTGKELVARLIHELDTRPDKRELVVVDCTTITPELSGSEFFGHERGAFTGAMTARDGAFALANGGTLFLDEIGELPLSLQAQLLRVIQEHKYKRVGSNAWQQTNFRLVCATNRDLKSGVATGTFRGDLYFRIAGWVCRTPPLRERKEDIVPLVSHFLAESDLRGPPLGLDEPVRQYLLTRDYPGNVRDLRRVVARLRHRHVGPGPITIGDVPAEERPADGSSLQGWLDGSFENAIRHAIDLGVGLREIGQAAAETAIKVAVEQEEGNLHRAACRLGVTDRALQMRRANRRGNH
jgi:transcriptional regulator with GAF, ATPase, and Fis domain